MNKVSIKRLLPEDKDLVSHIEIKENQSSFVSSPVQVLTFIQEVGDPKINCPYQIEASGKTIGFFTLNFYCPLVAGADPFFFGGENDCRLESFMIDRKFQGKGFGKAALTEIVAFLSKNHPEIRSLKLSVNFLNDKAKSLYLKFGFHDTGEIFKGGTAGPQHIYRLDLPKKTEI